MQRIMAPKDEDISEVSETLLDWERPALAEDTLICECYCVSVLDIREACATNRQVDLAALQSRFGLGTGCGQCVRDFANWKTKIFE